MGSVLCAWWFGKSPCLCLQLFCYACFCFCFGERGFGRQNMTEQLWISFPSAYFVHSCINKNCSYEDVNSSTMYCRVWKWLIVTRLHLAQTLAHSFEKYPSIHNPKQSKGGSEHSQLNSKLNLQLKCILSLASFFLVGLNNHWLSVCATLGRVESTADNAPKQSWYRVYQKVGT